MIRCLQFGVKLIEGGRTGQHPVGSCNFIRDAWQSAERARHTFIICKDNSHQTWFTFGSPRSAHLGITWISLWWEQQHWSKTLGVLDEERSCLEEFTDAWDSWLDRALPPAKQYIKLSCSQGWNTCTSYVLWIFYKWREGKGLWSFINEINKNIHKIIS